MANNKFTYQQTTKVSVDKKSLSEIAVNEDLSKTDYRVLILLLTVLAGYSGKLSGDPGNYTEIKSKSIAQTLNISNDKVKSSMDTLEELGYIEKGKTDTGSGWRFTF